MALVRRARGRLCCYPMPYSTPRARPTDPSAPETLPRCLRQRGFLLPATHAPALHPRDHPPVLDCLRACFTSRLAMPILIEWMSA